MSFPDVLMTGHQAFFTKEALEQIAEITFKNIQTLISGNEPEIKGAVVT